MSPFLFGFLSQDGCIESVNLLHLVSFYVRTHRMWCFFMCGDFSLLPMYCVVCVKFTGNATLSISRRCISYLIIIFFILLFSLIYRCSDLESEDYEFFKGLEFLLSHDVSDLGYELTFSTEVCVYFKLYSFIIFVNV